MPEWLQTSDGDWYQAATPEDSAVRLPVEGMTYQTPEPKMALPVDMSGLMPQPDSYDPTAKPGIASRVINQLTGANGQERYQTWPEKLVRSGATLASDVVTGAVPDMTGLRREDFTDSPAPMGFGSPVAAQPGDTMIERAQDMAGLMGGSAIPDVMANGLAKDALGIVPVAAAKKLKFETGTPSEVLKAAVENTPGASIDADGHLIVKLVRHQMTDQEGAESVRGGVFYLPEGDKNARHYNGTTGNSYGGQQKIEGETAFKNPLVVKGATGGKAPETAYNQIMGDKKAYANLYTDVMQIVNSSWMKKKDPSAYYDLVNKFLDKHAPEMRDYADYILDNSSKGNQLRYALSEAAIASAARKAGHDGIVGYSELRGPNKGKQRLSEVYDVRENRYPSPEGGYSVHPDLIPVDHDPFKLSADSGKAGAPIAAIEQQAPKFYSAVEHTIDSIPQAKASGDQWLSTLANKPGVKPEEMDWLGLSDFLKGKPSVSKSDLQDYIAAHKVDLQEVNKGASEYHQLKYKPTLENNLRMFDSILPEFKSQADIALARKHNPNFAETVKGESDERVWNAIQEAKKPLDYPDSMLQKYDTRAEAEAALNDAGMQHHFDIVSERKNSDTKYHSYQLPGGENYREMLMTLPSKVTPTNPIISKVDGAYPWKVDFTINGEPRSQVFKTEQEAKSHSDYVKTADTSKEGYKSSHWDEPNILAHVRMNDRSMPLEFTAEEKAALQTHEAAAPKLEDIRNQQRLVGLSIRDESKHLEAARRAQILADYKAGKLSNGDTIRALENYEAPAQLKPLQDKLEALRNQENELLKTLPKKPEAKTAKSLHLEEIQSDWHQQGRDKGYKPTQVEKSRLDELAKKKDKEGLSDKEQIEAKDLAQKLVSNGVPDAPFKKTWHELALKRMLREAAEKGYDRLSWTPGEAQAARYDLSKQIDSITYNPNTGYFKALDKTGKDISNGPVPKEKLADTIGKEAAEKLLKSEPNNLGIHSLQNADLKIGGEGMKGFYDQIIPKALEKMTKAHGVKVKQSSLNGGTGNIGETRNGRYRVEYPNGKKETFDSWDEAESALDLANKGSQVHYIDIPQSLKDQAMQKGFPLFSSGLMLSPVAHNPFAFTPVSHDPFKDENK